jgi:putative transcriptional regulator
MKNQLTALREKRGCTLSELATSVGVSTACIKAIENGSYDPSLNLAFDIAEALQTSVIGLFQPTPRRVRLEQLAARPWYVRLFLV